MIEREETKVLEEESTAGKDPGVNFVFDPTDV